MFLSTEEQKCKRPKRVQCSRERSLGIGAGLRESRIGRVNTQRRCLRYPIPSPKSIHRQKKASWLPGPEVSAGHFPVQTLKCRRQTKHPSAELASLPSSAPEQQTVGTWVLYCDISVSSAKPALKGLSMEKQTNKM